MVDVYKRQEYQALVEQYCQEFSVEPALCYAVIRTESSFNPEATSSIGARGLMQLTEETFDWVKSRLEPQSDTTYDAMYAVSYTHLDVYKRQMGS